MLYTPLFWSLFIANLLTVASFGAFFLFPLFVTAHGGSEAEIGLTMGVFACASAVCRPWVAEMIDRYGRRRSYLVGGALMTILPLCYLPLQGNLTDFILPLLILRALHGIGLAICFTAVFTFVGNDLTLTCSCHFQCPFGRTNFFRFPLVMEIIVLALAQMVWC